MQVMVELPDDIATYADPAREALEAIAIAGYRSAALSHFQASQLLGLSRLEFDGFLSEHHVDDHAYGFEDLEQDRLTIERVTGRKPRGL